jgi:heme-degrading monooxygenase HmoA
VIVRTWRGSTKREDGERYLAYVEGTGVAGLRATPGNRGVLVLRRDAAGRADFVVVSFWDSEQAIAGFAGPDIGRAVFYPEDDRFLIERDLHVEHYDLAHQAGIAGA